MSYIQAGFRLDLEAGQAQPNKAAFFYNFDAVCSCKDTWHAQYRMRMHTHTTLKIAWALECLSS
jgi:hypothetical protein